MASARLSLLGEGVVAGDLVWAEPAPPQRLSAAAARRRGGGGGLATGRRPAAAGQRRAAAAARALSAEEAASGKWSLHDVLVPLPGHAVAAAAPPVAEALAAALRAHRLDGADGAFWRQPGTFGLPAYRPSSRDPARSRRGVAYDDHTLPLLASDLDAIDGERRPAGGGGVAGAAPHGARAGSDCRRQRAQRCCCASCYRPLDRAEQKRRSKAALAAGAWRGGVARHRRRV